MGFETRFAVFAQEMIQRGPSFFPTTYGLPYPDYPAGFPFLNFLCTLVFGKFRTLTAIFPSAVASSITLVLIYQIALPLSREWARIAVLLALFTYEFVDSARSLAMDPFMMLSCLWAFYVAFSAQKTQNDNRFIWLALPLIFGFLIRGPIGLILPTGVAVAAFVAQAQWNRLLRFSIQALLLLIALMALLLLAAQHQGGNSFVKEVLIMQIFGRLNDHQTHDFFSYFTDSFANYAVSFELAIVTIILTLTQWKNDRLPSLDNVLLRSCFFWVCVILIGMSIPEVRKIRYIMPIVPALALLGAYLWVLAPTQRAARITTDIFHGLCLALPFISILLIIAAIVVIHLKTLDATAHYFSAFCTLTLLAVLSVFILGHHPIHYARRNPKKVIGLGLASFLTVIIFIMQPIYISLNRIHPFVNDVLANLQPGQSITFFQENRDAEPIQFISRLPQPVTVHINFAQQVLDKNTLYLTKAETFEALPDAAKQNVTIILRGKLGHREMVAFKINLRDFPS